MSKKILKTVDDVKNELKELDKIYLKNKIDRIDYENSKQDLYIYLYKLEKQGGCYE